jgi:hypothetical protein
MVWFFTAALAVSALSCPAGFLIGMFDSTECPQNTESARVVQGHDLWNSFCPSKYAMVVWTNTFWSVVVCAVLGVITLAVITVRAIVLRTRRSGPQESAGVYQGS